MANFDNTEEQSTVEQKKNIITSSTETMSDVITLMERMKMFLDKHGLRGILTTLLMLFIASVMAWAIFNPSAIFEKFEDFSQEKHEQLIKNRLAADPVVRNYLSDLRDEIGADRVYVLETHNGGANLSNLPFLYVDMTYADPNRVLTEFEDEYRNLRLSRYPWASAVYEEGFRICSIDDIADADPELYYRLQKEGVAYMGMMLIYGENAIPSGVLGVVYEEGTEVPQLSIIMKSMQKYTTVLMPLLKK